MNTEKLTNFLNLVSDEKSRIHKKMQFRKDNKGWLKKSTAIAIKVLDVLREKNLSQKALADLMGVTPQYINKIVKGQENLSLEVIDKLEKALGRRLVVISNDAYSYPMVSQTHRLLQHFATSQHLICSRDISIRRTSANVNRKSNSLPHATFEVSGDMATYQQMAQSLNQTMPVGNTQYAMSA